MKIFSWFPKIFKVQGFWLLLVVCTVILSFPIWYRKSREVHSIEAFINSEIIYIRAPIPGQIQFNSQLTLGTILKAQYPLGVIEAKEVNPLIPNLEITHQQAINRKKIVKEHILTLEQKLTNRSRLLQQFRQASVVQTQLEFQHRKAELKDLEAQLNRSRAEAQQREVDALRSQQLLSDGAISSAEAEESFLTAKRTQDFVAEVEAELEGQKLLIKAAQEGLQLVDGARSFSYPQIQVIELETEIADIQLQIIELNHQQEVLQTEIDRTAQELAAQKKATLSMPVKGVIWSIDTQSGEIVNANAPILQVINCNNVWVEAFVGESVANSIEIGQVAEISTPGRQETFLGKVQTIRAGTGRVNVGQYVVDPPPEIQRRQLPVRVSTLRIAVDWTQTPMPEKFCGAGLSVQVSFPSPDRDESF